MTPSASDQGNKLQKKMSLDELINRTEPLTLKLCIGFVLLAIVLFAFAFFLRTNKPGVPFNAVLDDGAKVERIRAFRYPNLTNTIIMQWAMEAATAAYTFDFYNYQTALNDIRPYFTGSGYDNFLASLSAAGTLNQVIEKKLIVSAVPTGSPIILNEGFIPGNIYAWQVQFPMLLTFQSQSDKTSTKVVVTLLIAEVPTLESPKGVGIASFITSEVGQ